MAITENIFTAEEIDAALTANPDLVNIIAGKALENAAIKGIIEPKIIGPKTMEFATNIEKDVFALTGIAKNGTEKYYEYMKRAVSESKTGLETQIAALKDKANPNAADTARIAQLEKLLTEKDTEFATKITEKDTEVNNYKKTASIETALQGLRGKYKPGLQKELVELAEQNAIKSLITSGEIQADNVLTFKDEKGEIMMNKSTYKPMTALEVLTEKLSYIIDAGKSQPGAGSGKDDIKVDPKDVKFTGVPEAVKTKTQLSDYLLTLGIMAGSPEYDKILAEHGKSLPLR